MYDSPIDHASCILNHICLHETCGFYQNCDIFQEIYRIARRKWGKWNFGYKNNRDKNGYCKQGDIIKVTLKAIVAGFRCPYCGKEMILGGNGPAAATIDHIIARALGGTNDKSNLRICCYSCNQEKSWKEAQIATNKKGEDKIKLFPGSSN